MNQSIDPFSGVLPRGVCLAWEPRLVWISAVTDGISALACLGIAAAAVVFLARRRDLASVGRGFGALLIAFLLVGFLTYVVQIVTLWVPAYGAVVATKTLTAMVSLGAAVLAWPQLPKLLSLPSPRDLARSNAALAQANVSLETAIAWRTYELEQANQRFEMALSRSNITLFSQDRALRHTWVHNPRPGLTPASDAESEPSLGGPPLAAEMARRVLATGDSESGAVAVPSPDGMLHFDLTVSPTRDPGGSIDGVLCTAVDVTERRHFDLQLAAMAAQLAAAYHRFELALENSPITVFEQGSDLRYSFVHNPPAGTEVDDFLGRTDTEVFGDAAQRNLVPAKQRVLETSRRETLELELRVAGQPRFYELRLEPRTSASGEVEGVIGTAVDLTERRRNEQQLRLVMRELTHRSKNLLAVVQAMANKTASLAPDVDSFIRDFSSRLRAIAAAHDILVAESWSGAELRELLVASLAQTVDPAAPEIRIEGPALKLSPDATQILGLAFHELTMNAAKHGALSVPGGRLSVAWRREGGEVRVDWREEDGPAVARPKRSGFGRVLLERLVGASLGGAVALEFRREGLACRITFPDDRLIVA
jgi:two-component sensor histidine kinase/PAS domain-containing protein